MACHLRDAKAVYDAVYEEAGVQGLEDLEIREFECLGACDMAPMASVNGRYVGPLSDDDASEIVSALKEGREALPGRGLPSDFRLPGARARPSRRDLPRSQTSIPPAGPGRTPELPTCRRPKARRPTPPDAASARPRHQRDPQEEAE